MLDYVDQIEEERMYDQQDIKDLGGMMGAQGEWTDDITEIIAILEFLNPSDDHSHQISGAQLLDWNTQAILHQAAHQYD